MDWHMDGLGDTWTPWEREFGREDWDNPCDVDGVRVSSPRSGRFGEALGWIVRQSLEFPCVGRGQEGEQRVCGWV